MSAGSHVATISTISTSAEVEPITSGLALDTSVNVERATRHVHRRFRVLE